MVVDRSNGPIKMPSTPGSAAISSICSSASTVSHWGMSISFSLLFAKYASSGPFVHSA